VGIHHERGESTEVVFVHPEFEWCCLNRCVFSRVESGDVAKVSDVCLVGIDTGFDTVVLVFPNECCFDVFGDFDPAQLRVHQNRWDVRRDALLFGVAVADVELIVGVVVYEDGSSSEVECESVDVAGFFRFGVEDVDLVTSAGVVLAIDRLEFDDRL
jgi:hypothetical protein